MGPDDPKAPQPDRQEIDHRPLSASTEEPELFIGLVGAMGCDLELVTRTLTEELSSVAYKSEEIHLSDLLLEIKGFEHLRNPSEEKNRIEDRMDAGNKLSKKVEWAAALAVLAIGEIQEKFREKDDKGGLKPRSRCAYILRSLKNPAEVTTLRDIYGDAFLLISAYCPKTQRLRHLSRRLAESELSSRSANYAEYAEHLIARDESDDQTDGQNVRDVFPEADVFIDASDPNSTRESLRRFIEAFFAYPFHTPTRDEFAMFHAQAAALRSAALQRQVGAAIWTLEGDIVAVGTNEVPKAGGGQYWYGDQPDNRDFVLGYETSDRMKKLMLGDIIKRLKKEGWLNDQKQRTSVESLLSELLRTNVMKDAQVMDLIEFSRPMHAEMGALLDAARRGVSVKECILSTTTFPCHDCARHIVGAGISRVVYIHPYPKSHVAELYPDSMCVDEGTLEGHVSAKAFIGIAPRRYMSLFTKVPRKTSEGKVVDWSKATALPRFKALSGVYLQRENEALKLLKDTMTVKGLL